MIFLAFMMRVLWLHRNVTVHSHQFRERPNKKINIFLKEQPVQEEIKVIKTTETSNKLLLQENSDDAFVSVG
jgi:hypothetical protein